MDSCQSYSKLQKELDAQDRQIAAIKRAENDFSKTGDIDAIIRFWENLWANGGLLFRGSHWTFRLADLYVQCKNYQAALRAVQKIRSSDYSEKKQGYIEKIERQIQKEQGRKLSRQQSV